MDYNELYRTNDRFRQYVDAYSNKYMEGKSIPVEEALTHSLLQGVGKEYAEGGANNGEIS